MEIKEGMWERFPALKDGAIDPLIA